MLDWYSDVAFQPRCWLGYADASAPLPLVLVAQLAQEGLLTGCMRRVMDRSLKYVLLYASSFVQALRDTMNETRARLFSTDLYLNSLNWKLRSSPEHSHLNPGVELQDLGGRVHCNDNNLPDI